MNNPSSDAVSLGHLLTTREGVDTQGKYYSPGQGHSPMTTTMCAQLSHATSWSFLLGVPGSLSWWLSFLSIVLLH